MNPTGFKWGQSASTVTVTFPVPPGVSKTQVDVSITSSTLVAGIKTQPPVLSGTLFDHVIASRSAWKLKSSVVTISMQKLSKNTTWATLLLATDGSPSRAAAAPSASAKKLMQCLHDYDATDPLELSFREGDVIVVIQENNTGWWKGELDGVVGLFPSNFTEELSGSQAVNPEYSEEVEELDDSTASVVAPASVSKAPAAKSPSVAAPTTTNTNAPPAVTPGVTKPPAGAVAVMRPVMGKPAALKVTSAYTSAPSNAPSSPTGATVPKAAPIALALGTTKPPAARTPPAAAVPKVASTPRSALEESGGGGDAKTGGAQVRAMYNYVAQDRGELSLKENDVVVLLKKDDSGWWQGSVTYTGWFPASFVEELND